MSELIQCPFEVDFEDDCIVEMRSATGMHKAILDYAVKMSHPPIFLDITVNCSCGGRWTHKPDTTPDQIKATFNAHLSYFSRNPIKPD